MPDDSNDTVDQKTAEAEVEKFRRQLGPFVVAAEKTRMAMIFTNAGKDENPIVFANDAFLHLTGFTREEVLGVCFKSLMTRAPELLRKPYSDKQLAAALAKLLPAGRDIAA